MSEPETETTTYARTAAALIALDVTDARLPEVAANLERIAAFARDVAAFPLAPTDEPATRFAP